MISSRATENGEELNLGSMVRLSGGLGNQLFQYGFARAVAHITQEVTSLDLSYYSYNDRQEMRVPEINRLIIDPSFFKDSTPRIMKLTSDVIPIRIRRRLRQRQIYQLFNSRKFLGRTVTIERSLVFDPEVAISSNRYYVGNFISPLYWNHLSDELIEHIRTLVLQYKLTAKIQDLTSGTLRIAVHARRGDFLSNFKTRNFHGYCGTDYYIKLVDEVLLKNPNIKSLLIASDSLIYAVELKGLLDHRFPAIEIDTNVDPILTLANLMSCEYFIGSNSTFSWWAAALGTARVSFFPKDWFASKNIEFSAGGHFPFSVELVDCDLLTEITG
jgi:hypothetical protein